MRCTILTPIKVGKDIHKAGEIELPDQVAQRFIARGFVMPSPAPVSTPVAPLPPVPAPPPAPAATESPAAEAAPPAAPAARSRAKAK